MTKLSLPYANKDLGQHFLVDKNTIHAICDDDIQNNLPILEIGPGPAILTEFLAAKKRPFFVIEKDERFKPYLNQYLSDEQIIFTDALAVNLENFIAEKFQSPIWLVSNLPYNVGSPLLINFLQAPSIKAMTLMFQKEVADKVFPFATTKNFMNSLLVLSQTYFECRLLKKVPPGAFNPPPKVDSAVLSMTRRENPLLPLNEFLDLEKFLRFMFSQKRKQLGGILKARYKTELIHEVFLKLNIQETVRAEALTIEQVLDLYRNFKV
jgi:16S rRNA (adenine1518-N6/adenine1519-N6)-dimethyltransferase